MVAMKSLIPILSLFALPAAADQGIHVLDPFARVIGPVDTKRLTDPGQGPTPDDAKSGAVA